MAKATLHSPSEADRLIEEWSHVWEQLCELKPTDHPDGNNGRLASPAYLVLEALSFKISQKLVQALGD